MTRLAPNRGDSPRYCGVCGGRLADMKPNSCVNGTPHVPETELDAPVTRVLTDGTPPKTEPVDQHIIALAKAARDAALVRLTKDNRRDYMRLMLEADEAECALIEACQDDMGGVWKVILSLAEPTDGAA